MLTMTLTCNNFILDSYQFRRRWYSCEENNRTCKASSYIITQMNVVSDSRYIFQHARVIIIIHYFIKHVKTAARLAKSDEYQTTVREVEGSDPEDNSQGL